MSGQTEGNDKKTQQIKMKFDSLLRQAKEINNIDAVFTVLAIQLKDTSTMFKNDYEKPGGMNLKFQGDKVSGGIFDLFIRKWWLSFNKMMFEDVAKLFENYKSYVKGEPYEFEQAKTSLNQFFNWKVQKFETEVNLKTHKELKEQFDGINVSNDYKKWFLNSMNDTFSKFSIPAVENLRKYIDHSLIEISKSNDVIYSLHNSLIPLSGLHVRLGNLDEGLISLIECIKLAQNKKDNQGIIKWLVWLQQIIKAFGNVEQAEMLILEQILIQWWIYNLPQVFNSMALEYAQMSTVYKRHNFSRGLQRIKRVKTEEKMQNSKDTSDDIISLIMSATQNNLMKLHQGNIQKEVHSEIKNYHVETKPMFRIIRSFQWVNEGEDALMLSNVNSLVSNFPEALKNIDITNSLYQIISKLKIKDDYKKKYIDMISGQTSKNDYYFIKLVLEHTIALKKYQLDSWRALEEMMLLYNDKTNSQFEYWTIWERRLQRLFKEELYYNALISAKEFIKFCEKQGFVLKKLQYELFIAKVNLKWDSYHEALFQALKIIEKTEEWQMTVLNLNSRLVLAEIHIEMGAYYESLTLLNEISTELISRWDSETVASFYTLKARTLFLLSSEVINNEKCAVALRKAAIKELEDSLSLWDKDDLYQQMREALFLKSVIAFQLAITYENKDKLIHKFEEFRSMSESCAKEFNNIDDFIQQTIETAKVVEIKQ